MSIPGQTKYRNTWPKELIAILSKGKSYSAFCAKNDLSEQGFRDFLKKHKEFADAYEVGRQKSKAFMEQLAFDHISVGEEDSKLNTTVWSMIMRNRFGLTEHRKVKVPGIDKAKTFAEKMKKIDTLVANGDLTTHEAAQLSKYIETGANVFEKTELVKRVEQIESSVASGVSDTDFKEEADAKGAD